MIQADVALLTDIRYTAAVAAKDDWYLANILADDRLLQNSLRLLNLSSRRVDWADPAIDFSAFRCAVFRTTWDYFERLTEFTEWLQVVRQQTQLCNEYATVAWNIDKHYLADLAAVGIPIVQSQFIERGTSLSLHELLDASGWDEAIIKPCVSGGARHTYRVHRTTASQIDRIVQPLLLTEAFVFQPFQHNVIDSGEDSLVLFNGRYSHALRKIAKTGDFRVQDDHGGTVHSCQPTPAQIELAERTMAACQCRPAYGRVDMIRDNSGAWAVMELELIEPELWLRRHPSAAEAFAAAIGGMIRPLYESHA